MAILHLQQRSDLLLQDVTPTSQRMKVVDLTAPWIYAYMAFLIPVPDGSDNTSNMSAIIKPFQWPVGYSTFPLDFYS